MNSVRSATAFIQLATSMCPRDLNAQSANQHASPPKYGAYHVQCSFSRAPWRTVIQWANPAADETDATATLQQMFGDQIRPGSQASAPNQW